MAKTKLRRGFRTEAEEYAMEYRAELELGPSAPLCPHELAEHLAIPVLPLSSHPTVPSPTKVFFAGAGRNEFSAVTLCDGSYREVIHNDYQSPNRQASNIMHELAHVVLGHPARPPLIGDACRNYDPSLELEANQLGFTLLVPKVAVNRPGFAGGS